MTSRQSYDEGELLLHITNGDEGAMEIVFAKYFSRLCYFAHKLTGGNKEEAEDIAQEALLNFWINVRDKGVIPQSTEAYLFQMVRNRCFNFNKRKKMKAGKENDLLQQAPLTENEVEQVLIQEDIFNKIYQQLIELPPRQAEIIKLIFLEELDTHEIAKRLQLTPNNIRNHKARAIETIRTLVLKKGLSELRTIVALFFY
jgi:RNA polymerase sigma factor (sigma-70 family)